MPIILATWDSDMGQSWFKASPSKKLSKALSQNQLGLVADTYNPNHTGGIGRRIIN
jgi:hypothetical protein